MIENCSSTLTIKNGGPSQPIEKSGPAFSDGSGQSWNRPGPAGNVENPRSQRDGPPKKRSPGRCATSAGTRRQQLSKSKSKSQRKNTKAKPETQAIDYQPRSPYLIASIERMRARPNFDVDAAAWMDGTAETQPARPRSNRHERRSQFVRYRTQRSPDRQKSYERRHRLAFSGPMPPHLAARFTVGEMACLRVVSDEHRAKGFCDLDLDAIAARAGVARKTAQRALRHAGPGSKEKGAKVGEGLLTIEERRPKGRRKHLPNIVQITSPEWLTWLKRRPEGGMKTGHSRPTTYKTIDNDVVPLRATSNGHGPQSGRPSKEAIAFATELASIAGHRLNRLPQSWLDTNPAQVVQTWINSLIEVGATLKGDPIAMLRLIASDVMRRKPDPQPPRSPRYFAPTVRQVVDQHIRARTMPLPKVAA